MKFFKVYLLFSIFLINSCYGGELREDCVLNVANNTSLKIQVARTEQERATGLMYRKKMAANRGMLFIFPYEEEHSFWMKNTFLALDMIFLDKNGEVKKIIKNVPPLTKKARESEFPVKYVLELNAGQSDQFSIIEGRTLRLDECLVN